MKKITATILFGCFFSCICFGQTKFTATISNDSILLGNYFEVIFTLKNSSGSNFNPPEFKDYDIVSGPNQSMQSSFINGVSSQTLSYSYFLKPKDIGNYYLSPADIETKEGILETTPVEINVFPNPDNIIQENSNKKDNFDPFNDFQFFDFPEKKKAPKKKRRVYKI